LTVKIPLQNVRSFGPAADMIAEMSSRRVVDRAFKYAGLSNDVLSGPPIFIPYALQAIFVEDAARQLGARHLGAILAGGYGYRALGRFADYVLDAPRLDAAFARSARAMPFLLDGPAVEVRDVGEHAVLQFDSRLHPLRGAHHVDEGLALLIVDLVQSFHGPDWRPAWIELPGRPDSSDTTLDSLFEAPMRFGAALPGVALSRAELVQANPRHRIAREAHILSDLREMTRIRPPQKMAELVKDTLHLQVAVRDFSEDAVAARLGLGRRTLQRQLRLEGVVFRDLLNEFKADRARAMLIETDHSIVEIANALGYEEVNSFRRAFQNWTGLSPSAFRGAKAR
jgi:AraC-like DNA-binding protein